MERACRCSGSHEALEEEEELGGGKRKNRIYALGAVKWKSDGEQGEVECFSCCPGAAFNIRKSYNPRTNTSAHSKYIISAIYITVLDKMHSAILILLYLSHSLSFFLSSKAGRTYKPAN